MHHSGQPEATRRQKRNAHLDAEYLAVLETDNATLYFLNLHNGEVPHTLILGMTGSGKCSLSGYVKWRETGSSSART
jgi:type IV secretory pathway VirB4 component